MIKIVFLGSFFSNDREKEIRKKSKGAVANANNTFQKAILHGFSKHPDFKKKFEVDILNMPNIGAYPLKYKELYFKNSIFTEHGINGVNLSFFNCIYIKHYFKYRKIKSSLKKLFKDIDENTKIHFLVYDLYEPYLHALKELKKEYKFRISVIVPDLIGFTGAPNNFLYAYLTKLKRQKVYNELMVVDSFILLCDSMKLQLPINDKPYIVVEGIYQNGKQEEFDKNSDEHIILYSGALDERNGVINLLKAFSLIEEINYRLVLCGDGSARNIIEKAAAVDSRIIYKGQLPHNEILLLQKQSSLLVNPRLPIEEFTKYSFPSKTMEYMASGTPVLMYKLLGVPDEYFNHCFVLYDFSIDSLAKKIKEICNIPSNELLIKAVNAKRFILNEKNS